MTKNNRYLPHGNDRGNRMVHLVLSVRVPQRRGGDRYGEREKVEWKTEIK